MANEQMVVIEVMPSYLVDSHRAADNWGSFPHNGSLRYLTTRSWAEEVTTDAEYDHIVREAVPSDKAVYDELPEQW